MGILLTHGIDFARFGPTFMKKSLKCSDIDFLSVVAEPLLNINFVWYKGFFFPVYNIFL